MLEVLDDWFWPPFLKIYALESRFCFTSTKKTIATVHNTLMSVYTCLVITCKWPTSGHFWLCDRKIISTCDASVSLLHPTYHHQCTAGFPFFLLSSILIMAAFASILSAGSSTPATPRRNLPEPVSYLRNADHISTR